MFFSLSKIESVRKNLLCVGPFLDYYPGISLIYADVNNVNLLIAPPPHTHKKRSRKKFNQRIIHGSGIRPEPEEPEV